MAPRRGVMLSPEAMAELAGVVREHQASFPRRGTVLPTPGVPNSSHHEFVRITSLTQTAGRYPGKLLIYDTAANTFADVETIWVVTPNGETLATGTNYEARLFDAVAGVTVFMVGPGTGGGSVGAGVSLQAIRVYTPAGVTTWTLAGGTTVTPTAGGGLFATTTIAAGSDGATLPTGTLNVADTTGFPSAGTLHVALSSGSPRLNIVTYTGTTPTSFTGCAGGTGTIHTGDNLFTLAQYTWAKPAGLKYARVWVVGGGGRGGNAIIPGIAGGGVPGMAAAGGGGAGGGGSFKTFGASALQATMTVLPGLGGPSNSNWPGAYNGGVQNFNLIGRCSQFNNATPATGTITNATNATPIVVTSTAHGLGTNDSVTISGVGGNTNANREWLIIVIDADHFSLADVPGGSSSGNAAYTSGGTWTQTVLLSTTGGWDGTSGGISKLGTLVNLANVSTFDNDGASTLGLAASLYPGQGGLLEDGNPGGSGDINWIGEMGGYGLVVPDYQIGPAGSSGDTGGGYGVTPAASVRNYGPGSPSATGPGVPGGVPGSLGFTLIELVGTYKYVSGPQFNAVGGKGGRAGGPFSSGGYYGALAARKDVDGPGTGGTGAVAVWPYGTYGSSSSPPIATTGSRIGAPGTDGMVVIEEYY